MSKNKKMTKKKKRSAKRVIRNIILIIVIIIVAAIIGGMAMFQHPTSTALTEHSWPSCMKTQKVHIWNLMIFRKTSAMRLYLLKTVRSGVIPV